jgi:hypothetical protein
MGRYIEGCNHLNSTRSVKQWLAGRQYAAMLKCAHLQAPPPQSPCVAGSLDFHLYGDGSFEDNTQAK